MDPRLLQIDMEEEKFATNAKTAFLISSLVTPLSPQIYLVLAIVLTFIPKSKHPEIDTQMQLTDRRAEIEEESQRLEEE